MRDPRSHRRYVDAAREYKARNMGCPCALCGMPVHSDPTVEHRLPIRTIRLMAGTYAEAVQLACDQSMWGIAHKRCNAQQGARAVNAQRPPSNPRW